MDKILDLNTKILLSESLEKNEINNINIFHFINKIKKLFLKYKICKVY